MRAMVGERSSRITSDGLDLAGRHHRLFSGEMHFWRHRADEWPRILDAVRDLGFTTISTYASWARHTEGAFDRSTLDAFLGLLHRRGFKAVVRVGPNSGAEQQDSGWPSRVLDDPPCRALRPNGDPYLLATATHHAYMPSYASRETLKHIATWYDAIAAWVAPWQVPDGPVIAVQVDNELGYHFQAHAYALDYHPDAIAQYQSFLLRHYGDLAALNEAYRSNHASFDAVDPPRDGVPDPTPWHLDWIRFKEQHLRDTLAFLAAMLRERGLDSVPLVHNDYPRTTTPQDLGVLERAGAIDLAGADIYATKEGGAAVRDLARHLAGSSVLPYMAELGTGWLTLPWLLPLRTTPLDEEHATLRALVHGVRAANVYQLVERDRWYGSPISAHGEEREPKASFYRRLHSLLDGLEWERLRRDAPVLIVENRDIARRVAARARLGDVVPCFSQLLPVDLRLLEDDDPEQTSATEWDKDVTALCAKYGYEADRASSDALPELGSYRVVAMQDGDASGFVETPEEVETALNALGKPAFRCTADGVDLVRLTGAGREVLAAINGTPASVESTIEFDGSAAFSGRWTAAELKGDGAIDIALEPWAIQIFQVQR